VALCFFFGLATLINRLFAAMIRENEYLCMLSWHHIASITLIIMVIAIFSATGAAWRVTRLEPVEALRDE
jgi:putative ABC transport system permease protein